jgi:hypothetical protein
MLREIGGKISFDDKVYDDPFCIAYDGGNHAEYASSMRETVESIQPIGDYDFCVEVEGDRVASYRLIFDDVCSVWEIVSSYYKDFEGSSEYKKIIALAAKYSLDVKFNVHYNDELDILSNFGEAIDLETLENPACVEVVNYVYVDLLGGTEIEKLRESTDELDRYQRIVYELMETKRPQYIVNAKDGIVQGLLWCEF